MAKKTAIDYAGNKAMMAILCSDGQLNINDVTRECITQKWVPLLVYKDNDDGSIFLPVFSLIDTAKDFIKRNLPKNWIKASVILSNEDICAAKDRGWNIEHFSFPRKINGSQKITLGFEIHEFVEQPDFLTSRF